MADLRRQRDQKSKKVDQMLSYPGVKARLELEDKINTFPPGVLEDFAEKGNIDKYS